MAPRKINVADQGRNIDAVWSPVIAGQVNDSQIKLVRIGEVFDWHAHEGEDEAFLVLDGRMAIDFEDEAVELGPHDLIVVPRTVRHRPRALTERPLVLLFEPDTTLNTGDAAGSDKTKLELERL